MPECIYKSPDDGICCCSTSGHHCETVSSSDCDNCDRHQEETIVSDKVLLQRAISNALELLPNVVGNDNAVEILENALKI